uniref:Taste receptor type 2 n=1 Tax=Scleropages formosus TaxID=113540 RepID=A0A8C9RFF7_SCLFO
YPSVPKKMVVLNCVIATFLWVPGFFSNLFIVISSAIDIYMERSLQPVEVLLAFNSLCNLAVCMLNFVMVLLLAFNFCPHISLMFFWESSSGIQKWSASLVCMFFFFKILPMKNRVGLWLKSHFCMVLTCVFIVGCLSCFSTSVIDLFSEEWHNETSPQVSGNCSFTRLSRSLSVVKLVIKVVSYTSVLFLMIFPSGALMVHLVGHVRKMRGNMSEKNCASQDGVTRAAFMIFFLSLEFIACITARHVLSIIYENVFTHESVNSYCLANLILTTIVPITLIAGINTLRWKAINLCTRTTLNDTNN